LVPSVIYAASLKRTREFAAIVAKIAGVAKVVIDERLDEIDYGPMGGLSTEEIVAANPAAQAALDAWGKSDLWPAVLGWTSREAERVLRGSGIAHGERKPAIDRLSAVILLQSYLDSAPPEPAAWTWAAVPGGMRSRRTGAARTWWPSTWTTENCGM